MLLLKSETTRVAVLYIRTICMSCAAVDLVLNDRALVIVIVLDQSFFFYYIVIMLYFLRFCVILILCILWNCYCMVFILCMLLYLNLEWLVINFICNIPIIQKECKQCVLSVFTTTAVIKSLNISFFVCFSCNDCNNSVDTCTSSHIHTSIS